MLSPAWGVFARTNPELTLRPAPTARQDDRAPRAEQPVSDQLDLRARGGPDRAHQEVVRLRAAISQPVAAIPRITTKAAFDGHVDLAFEKFIQSGRLMNAEPDLRLQRAEAGEPRTDRLEVKGSMHPDTEDDADPAGLESTGRGSNPPEGLAQGREIGPPLQCQNKLAVTPLKQRQPEAFLEQPDLLAIAPAVTWSS